LGYKGFNGDVADVWCTH